ncbi:MAG: hypothetical protein M0R20_02570 [Candidatus Omnitrophica bacterium]|nr:hypothetical protein [Candidatus Omnitrophota bacterium]
MRNKVICLCFVSLLFLGNAFCDTIILKSGKQVEGSIKTRTDDAVKVDIEGITITYYFTDIKSINGENVASSLPAEPVSAIEAQQPPASVSDSNTLSVKENAAPTPNMTERAVVEEPTMSVSERSMDISEFERGTSRFSRGKLTEKDAKIAAAVFGGIFLFIIVLSLIFYVYSAICLFFIAKKTNTEPAWLAWIPVANLFLMCDIAKIKYLWLLGILGLFIPFINILANIYLMGLFVYVWYKIAIARNKPGWLGILTIVPVVNLVIMGYLAFAE